MAVPNARQGKVYRIDLGGPGGSKPSYRHPHVVVQSDVYTRSRFSTAIVCTLTSSLRRAEKPRNVLFAPGEARLPRPGVLSVTRVFTVDRSEPGESIDRRARRRVRAAADRIGLVIAPTRDCGDR